MLTIPDLIWIGAVAVGALAAVRSAEARQLRPTVMYRAALLALGAALVGGRVLDVLTSTRGTGTSAWWGPQAYYGGLFAGLAAALAVFVRCREGAPRYLDAAAPAIALGYALGRIGCFVNGDDAGVIGVLPWAVTYGPETLAFSGQVDVGLISDQASRTLPTHPVQLYDSAAAFLLFLVLRRQNQRPGVVFGLFCMVHAATRFALEPLRADAVWLGGVSRMQLLSLGLFGAGLVFVVSRLAYREVRWRPADGDGIAA